MSKIHYVMLLDSSPSMYSYKKPTLQGANQVIATLKNAAKENSANIGITIVSFARTSELLVDDVNAKNVKPITDWGDCGSGTALYEALCSTLDHIKDRVKKKDKVVINIFTDGQDNSESYMRSMEKRYNAAICAQMCQEVIGTGRYTLTFVAANQDARRVAAEMHIPASNAMDYQQTNTGTRAAFWLLAKAARRYVENVVESWNDDYTAGFFDGIETTFLPMKVKDLEITVNVPESLHSDDENDELPPYAPVNAYVVDEYPACPDSWEHGSAMAASYFIPVKENHGLWFDFNKLTQHKHDIATVVSIQGVNSITGQKTSELCLEKYETKCPVHDVEFAQERFCDKCGFKWPAQNYLSTNAQPNGQMWLDGFRTPEGKVRQFMFTAEEMKRGVAQAILGGDRVHAVGFAFYRSKEEKPQPKIPTGGFSGYSGCSGFSGFSGFSGSSGYRGTTGVSGSVGYAGYVKLTDTQDYTRACSFNDADDVLDQLSSLSNNPDQTIISHHAVDIFSPLNTPQQWDTDNTPITANALDTDTGRLRLRKSVVMRDAADVQRIKDGLTPKSYEVAAGARINQLVHEDTKKMEYWEDAPYAFLYLNYTDEETCNKILSAGKRTEVAEGFLAEVPVGNL